MKFRIEIECDSQTFAVNGTTQEISEILRLATCRALGMEYGETVTLRDSNGNPCGKMEMPALRTYTERQALKLSNLLAEFRVFLAECKRLGAETGDARFVTAIGNATAALDRAVR